MRVAACVCVSEPMSSYVVEWLQSTCPSATMRRRRSAPPGAVMFCPMTQNTAVMSFSARKSRSSGVVPEFGPSSKVSAATFPVP
ncbi:hypothetical protein SRABI128_02796 [Microbacterium sp. Bi128]|nr:hypothetical protein SRABI128_02796 [Microbacterium sp. Bi128]